MKKAMMFVALAAALGFSTAEAADLTWSGDVRFRYESSKTTKDTDSYDYSRDRWRTRVRFGTNAWINDEFSAGVQLSTGDPANAINETVSRNATYSGLFQPKSIYLNEAFIDYHPMSYGLDGKVNFVFGKRDVAKSIVRVDDLLYDGDLTLEGATLQYGKDASGKEKEGLVFVAGYYFLDERSITATDYNKSSNNPAMTVVQAALKGEIDEMTYMIGAGDHMFRDLNNFSVGVSGLGTVFTNSIGNNGATGVFDRNIVELFGNIGGQVTDTLPWKLYGQYAFNTTSNTAFDDSKKSAWLAGVTLGDAKQPGQWAVDFNYNSIGRDAVYPIFTDSDRKVGNWNSNTEGWEVGTTYHLVQNLTLGAKYYNYRQIVADAGDPRLHTLQVDLVAKF